MDYQAGMANMITIPFIFFIQILALGSKSEAKVSAIIVFGDSSVDSGNNNYIQTIAKGNFEPYGRDFPGGIPTGRFSNGRLPPDFISEGFGLKPIIPAYLDPSLNISEFATGVCFASAATGYDKATADILKVIPLWKQVEYYKDYQKKLRAYLGDNKANEIISDALYLTSIGTNDFLENYYGTLSDRRSQFTVQQYEDFLIGIAENFVRQIYSLGARKLSLTGLPVIGCLPVQRATNLDDRLSCVEERNRVALEFNGKLKTLVAKLNKDLPGLKVFFADAYDILLRLITKPSEYGFEVVEKGCCGTGLFETGILCNRYTPLCPDANKYVFWDEIHPSQRTNKLISDNFLPALKQLFL